MSQALDRIIAGLAGHRAHEENPAEARQAAVALLLTPDPDQLLLIKRAIRADDPWSGHLALPGGRRDREDADLLATAIRETREETGLVLQREWCVAQLDDLGPVTRVLPPLVVRPYVFRLAHLLKPGVSEEVAQSVWVPFEQLRTSKREQRLVSMPDGQQSVFGYQLEQGFLWGMTERMIRPVIASWEKLQVG